MIKKIRLFLPILLLIAAILACESNESVSVEEDDEPTITLTEKIEEPSPTKVVNTPTPKHTPTPSPLGYAAVTANLCNLRSGPGSDYSIVGSAEKSEIVPVFGKSADNYWLLIDNKQSVWIAASLVEVDTEIDSISIVDMDGLTSPDSDSIYSEDDHQEFPDVEDVEAALTCDDIYKQHKDLTDVQWRDYVNIIVGKPIEFTGSVYEVKTNGTIEIGACSGLFMNVTFSVYGIPKDVGLTLQKYEDVVGEGTISQVYRKNVLVKGLLFTRLEEYLYINVYGTLETVE